MCLISLKATGMFPLPLPNAFHELFAGWIHKKMCSITPQEADFLSSWPPTSLEMALKSQHDIIMLGKKTAQHAIKGALHLLLATRSLSCVIKSQTDVLSVSLFRLQSGAPSFLALCSKVNGTRRKSKGFRKRFIWHTTLVRLDGCQSHDTGASVSSSSQECCALIHSSSYTPATSPSSLWSSWFGGCSPCGPHGGGPNTPPPRWKTSLRDLWSTSSEANRRARDHSSAKTPTFKLLTANTSNINHFLYKTKCTRFSTFPYKWTVWSFFLILLKIHFNIYIYTVYIYILT